MHLMSEQFLGPHDGKPHKRTNKIHASEMQFVHLVPGSARRKSSLVSRATLLGTKVHAVNSTRDFSLSWKKSLPQQGGCVVCLDGEFEHMIDKEIFEYHQRHQQSSSPGRQS